MKPTVENRKFAGALLSWRGLTPVLALLLCSCSVSSRPKWHPADPLARLHDVHGLFGGNELLVDQSGQVWDRRVDDRQGETRYHIQLTSGELSDLNRTIHESGILRYREKPYAPGPCLTRMKITITRPGKHPFTAEMWDHFDKAWEESNFTPFRHYLETLCKRAEKQRPYYSGRHDSQRPLP
jgi:hypothetical protein